MAGGVVVDWWYQLHCFIAVEVFHGGQSSLISVRSPLSDATGHKGMKTVFLIFNANPEINSYSLNRRATVGRERV